MAVNVVMGSAFRNSAANIPTYMARASRLQEALVEEFGCYCFFRIVAAEGDSTDGTRDALQTWATRVGLGASLKITPCDHGGPVFGSTEEPERLKALSKVGNAIFESVRPFDDVLLYVESDLRWEPEALVKLVHHALERPDGFDIYAPLVMAGPAFYDVWAFRGLDGRRFSPFAPYYPGLDGTFFEVGSVGSCLAMKASVARECRIRDDNCLVGWCADARRCCYRIAVDPTLFVRQA